MQPISIILLLVVTPIFPQSEPVKQPQVQSVAPNPATGTSYPLLFTIYGSNFTRQGTILLRDLRTDETFRITNVDFRSSSEIAIRPIFTPVPSSWSVAVIDSNRQASKPFEFDVHAPAMAPRILRVDPGRVPGLNGRQHFTISGENFVSGCTVRLRDKSTGEKFDIRPPAKVMNVHQIPIEANFTASPALWSVEVINPGGQQSGQYLFRVMSSATIQWMQMVENWKFTLSSIFFVSGLLLAFLVWMRHQMQNHHATALRESENRWKERLSVALVEQRREFRSDLHDSISYDVARVSSLCHEALAVGQTDALPERVRTTISMIGIAARDMENDLADLLWLGEFHDGSLNSLIARLRQRIREFLSEAGVHVELKTPPPGPDQSVSLAFAKNVLLVVSEILNNILKHSGATEVIARIIQGPSELTICIEDNGCGFDVESPSGQSQGLKNIRNRTETKLGGRADIQSSSQGTIVRLVLPLPSDAIRDRSEGHSSVKANLPQEAFVTDSPSPPSGDSRPGENPAESRT